MANTAIDLRSLVPLDRSASVELGRVEYRRIADAFRELPEDAWSRPTDCEGWTVRDLAGHVVGSMRAAASFPHFLREQVSVLRRRRRTGEPQVDAMTALHVEQSASLRTTELVELMTLLAGTAADRRARVPKAIAKLVRFKVEMGTISERWTLDFLLGPILTRDTWLHRASDLARATGATPALDLGHDGQIVADIAADWARRHGQPVELVLTGPAGGMFTAGQRGPTIELDAVELCRILSGRADPTHSLLETQVPF